MGMWTLEVARSWRSSLVGFRRGAEDSKQLSILYYKVIHYVCVPEGSLHLQVIVKLHNGGLFRQRDSWPTKRRGKRLRVKTSLYQPIPRPKAPLEDISMDFALAFLTTQGSYDLIFFKLTGSSRWPTSFHVSALPIPKMLQFFFFSSSIASPYLYGLF